MMPSSNFLGIEDHDGGGFRAAMIVSPIDYTIHVLVVDRRSAR